MAVKSSFKNMTICLLAICLVCSGLLAGVYALTKEPIDAASKAKNEAAIKEVLPELTETIYAFEQDEYIDTENNPVEIDPIEIEIPVETEDVNLNKLTAEQMADCKEVLELWKANPKLAEDKLNEVKELIVNGKPAQEIVNEDYASIYVLKMSPQKWAVIGGYFNEKS